MNWRDLKRGARNAQENMSTQRKEKGRKQGMKGKRLKGSRFSFGLDPDSPNSHSCSVGTIRSIANPFPFCPPSSFLYSPPAPQRTCKRGGAGHKRAMHGSGGNHVVMDVLFYVAPRLLLLSRVPPHGGASISSFPFSRGGGAGEGRRGRGAPGGLVKFQEIWPWKNGRAGQIRLTPPPHPWAEGE